MLLPPEEASLFLSLYQWLIGFAGGRLGGVAGIVDIDTFRSASWEARAEARDAMLDNIPLINDFIEENPRGFREKELSNLTGFERFVRGKFFVERDLNKYAVFINDETPAKAYGVLGLRHETASWDNAFETQNHGLSAPR